MMSTMNLALVAGVAALLVLLLVMRRNTADGASSPKTAKPPKPAKAPKVKATKEPKAPKAPRAKRAKAEKAPKTRATRGRGRRGRGADETPPEPLAPMPLGAASVPSQDLHGQETTEFGIPTSPVPGEPDWDAMRAAMHGLDATDDAPVSPAPVADATSEPVTSPEPAAAPEPVAVRTGEPAVWADDEELITEPGWPLPGDMDGGWDDSSADAGTLGAPVAAEAPSGDGWLGQQATPAAAPVAEEPVAEEEDAMWAPDPATAWKAAQESTVGQTEATDAGDGGSWLGGDVAEPVAEVVAESEAPAWDASEWDTPAAEAPAESAAPAWTEPVAEEAPGIGGWNAEPVAEEAPSIGGWNAEPVAEEAPSIGGWNAEPVAEEAPGIGGWAAEPVAEEAPGIGGWNTEPVAEEAPGIGGWNTEPVTETAPEPVAEASAGEWNSSWNTPADTAADTTADEPWSADAWQPAPAEGELVGAGAESAATLAPEAPALGGWDTPVAEADEDVSEPAAEWAPPADDAWASALATATGERSEVPVTSWNVDDPAEWAPPAELVAEPVAEAPVAVAPVVEEPVSVAPVASEPEQVPPAPVEAVVPEVAATVETVIEVPAPVVEHAEHAPVDPDPAPLPEGLAWWDDIEPGEGDILIGQTPDWMRGPGDERFTGRWSLGGMALQPGHQALGGVTFRQPLDSAPVTWSLPTRGRPEPGTLVLVVEALMNCDAKDLKVLTDAGFAPSREGFTVTLTASATGPFAASGTFRYLEG